MTTSTHLASLREELAATQAALAEAEATAARRVQRAHQLAGTQHTRAVLALYELLQLEPEHPSSRTRNGISTPLIVDKHEDLRTERLVTVIISMVKQIGDEGMQALRAVDNTARNQRREARSQRREARHRPRTERHD